MFVREVTAGLALRMRSLKVIEVDEFALMAQRYEARRRNLYMNVLPAARAGRIIDVSLGDAALLFAMHWFTGT